jgi:prephenate dehydrogenase
MQVAVIGTGLIGASVGLAAKRINIEDFGPK